MEEAATVKDQELVIRLCAPETGFNCPLCGHLFGILGGPQVVVLKTEEPVCYACAARRSPVLARLVQLGSAVDQTADPNTSLWRRLGMVMDALAAYQEAVESDAADSASEIPGTRTSPFVDDAEPADEPFEDAPEPPERPTGEVIDLRKLCSLKRTR